MDLFIHVLWRELLHLMAGFAAVPALQVVWFEMRRAGFLPKLGGMLYAAVPIFVVMGMVAFREPWDASQPTEHWWKSWIDYAGWLAGMLAYFAFAVRYRHRNHEWTNRAVRQLGTEWTHRLGLWI